MLIVNKVIDSINWKKYFCNWERPKILMMVLLHSANCLLWSYQIPLSLDLWACKLTQAGSRAWWMITYLSCWELQIGTFFPENKFPIWKWIFIVQEVLLKQEDLVEMRKRDDAEEKSRSFWLISKYFHNVYRSGNFLGALSRFKSEYDTSRLDFKMGTILLERTNDDDM